MLNRLTFGLARGFARDTAFALRVDVVTARELLAEGLLGVECPPETCCVVLTLGNALILGVGLVQPYERVNTGSVNVTLLVPTFRLAGHAVATVVGGHSRAGLEHDADLLRPVEGELVAKGGFLAGVQAVG